jgi:hypothetical protein
MTARNQASQEHPCGIATLDPTHNTAKPIAASLKIVVDKTKFILGIIDRMAKVLSNIVNFYFPNYSVSCYA